MSTGTKIVQAALQTLGAHSPIKPARPESIENGRDRLNSMMSDWYDEDIILGIRPLEAVGDELGEPVGTTNAIIDNLAVLLQPDHPGTQISAQLRINATKGYRKVKRRFRTTTIPNPVVRQTLPKGQGNKRFLTDSYIYFGSGDTLGED